MRRRGPTDLQSDGSTDRRRRDLDERDVRALEQYLTVLPMAPGLYEVVSESGNSYVVDIREGACECDDYTYREPEGGCKHVRRVAFALGERPIPEAVDSDDVDEQLGIHVEGTSASKQMDDSEAVKTDEDAVPVVPDGGRIIEAGDEGEVLEEPLPRITTHREPIEQGGAKYYRCQGCHRETIYGREQIPHAEGCPRRGARR